jgi:Protein of unknown function (DUF4229)
VSQGDSDDASGATEAWAQHTDSTAQGAGNRAAVPVLLYTTARLLLAVVLTGVIYAVARVAGITPFPVVVAALFALIIAMPLGIWLFSPLRRRATAALAIAGERRRRERELLQARLRGAAAVDEAGDDE